MIMKSRIVASVLILCCGNGMGRRVDAAPRQELHRPNIIFIMADDHTTQAIGAYGSRLAKLNPFGQLLPGIEVFLLRVLDLANR